MGALHPAGSLYENPVDLKNAQREHRNLVATLEKNGVKVVRVRDILRMVCNTTKMKKKKHKTLIEL